jgi:hypothetical protein
MIFRFFTNDFQSGFGEEMAVLNRHLETLKNETTLSHRLHLHTFMAENKPEAPKNTVLVSDIEEVW